MGQSVQKILAPLDGAWDRIIRRPMSSEDVVATYAPTIQHYLTGPLP